MLPAPFDPAWLDAFTALHRRLDAALGPLAREIHHVGSTAVPGLAAKPILDVDVEIADATALAAVTGRLASLGYEFQGDRGVADRFAYRSPAPARPEDAAHHLYVCPSGSEELGRHLRFRDRLNTDAALRQRYAALKDRCVREAAGDRARYVDAKARLGASFFAEALAEDPELAGLRVRRMRAEDPAPLAAAFADMNKSVEQFERYWRENLAGTRRTLLAVLGERIVGYTNLIWSPDHCSLADVAAPEIRDMNTVTPLRQRGIGTRMIAVAEAHARAAGRSMIGIGVGLTPDYAIAQRLYPKLGYQPDGHPPRIDASGACLYALKSLRHSPVP